LNLTGDVTQFLTRAIHMSATCLPAGVHVKLFSFLN
jgi:hypothetical protein